uniref:NADH dehydrogenase subunit 2 n=1 Tax=Cryptonema producta TaxID=870231 RepID=UPI0022370906|nr:NADH dehydrogenase subunit 2 [Cryptonema producta]UYR95077.1 NADH dehydrogenase subunit 2 [Cryptonema producta]
MSLSGLASGLCSIIGVFISLSSLSLLGIWVGIEVNFMGVLCFLSGSSVEEAEGTMKYYLAQVLGSCFSVMGFLMIMNGVGVSYTTSFILIGMLMKLGAFPFHFWVGPVVSKLSWTGCVMVMIIQKIVPLWVVSNFMFTGEEMSCVEFLSVCTCAAGSLGGLGVLNYRVLMGFSSIQHNGYLLLLSCSSSWSLWVYFIIYSIISSFMMLSLWEENVSSFLDLTNKKGSNNLWSVWWISMYFLSLAGLPPFTGFVLKSYFLMSCWDCTSIGSALCILTSIVSLFFYLSVVLSMSIFWGSVVSWMNKSKEAFNFNIFISVVLNLALGPILFMASSL